MSTASATAATTLGSSTPAPDGNDATRTTGCVPSRYATISSSARSTAAITSSARSTSAWPASVSAIPRPS
ncbi:Uncharacterised protein [Mycobacteroides abscessus subsp. abscessus]|nr:Uncharacterised protein [Mycobacteroides abscessus subsp. abscessus]